MYMYLYMCMYVTCLYTRTYIYTRFAKNLQYYYLLGHKSPV